MAANSLAENYNNRPWSKHSKKPPSQPQASDKPADNSAAKTVPKVCTDFWLCVLLYFGVEHRIIICADVKNMNIV